MKNRLAIFSLVAFAACLTAMTFNTGSGTTTRMRVELQIFNTSPSPGICDDLIITAPDTSGTVSCTAASDEGLPNPPGALTYAWSFVSDCPGVTEAFSDSTAAQPTITGFSADVGTGECTARRTVCDAPEGNPDRLCSTEDLFVTRVTAPAPGELALTTQEINCLEGTCTSVQVCVSRSNGSSGTVGATLTAIDGTALDGEDYSASSGDGAVSFGNGVTTQQCRTYDITNDENEESVETFSVALSDATGGATIVAPSSVTVVITDDDAAVAMVNIADGSWSNPTSATPCFTWQSYSDSTTCYPGGTCNITICLSNGPYTVGQYLNGDPWVVDPAGAPQVRIQSMTPTLYVSGSGTSATIRHGWSLNPSSATTASYEKHPFDNRDGDSVSHDATYLPNGTGALPIDVSAPTTVLKSASENGSTCQNGKTVGTADGTDDRACIRNYAALTVVASAPSATSFRPPIGTSAALRGTTFEYNAGRESIIPSVAAVSGIISRATAERRVGKARWFPLEKEIPADRLRPEEQTQNWGARSASLDNDVLLWVMSNASTLEERRGAIFGLIQFGIDVWGGLADGMTYAWGGGGNQASYYMPILFAAEMLNSTTIRNTFLSNSSRFFETNMFPVSHQDGRITYGRKSGFGQGLTASCRWLGFIEESTTPSGCSNQNDQADPWGYIDGPAGRPGTVYANASGGFSQAMAMAAELMPQLYSLAASSSSGPRVFTFGRRVFDHGLEMRDECSGWNPATCDPSSAAAVTSCPGWGTSWGPVGGTSQTECIEGSGSPYNLTRAERMTSFPDGSSFGTDAITAFQRAVRDTYKGCSRSCGSPCSGMVSTPYGC